MLGEEYLQTSFEDGDLEYVNGELVESNLGEIDRSDVQGLICSWFWTRWTRSGFHPLISVRTRVSPTRYRLRDITVVLGQKRSGRVIAEPPFLVIEVLSP
jgi:Uma2 family endonuclease